jgi:hypothetical protein
LALEGADPAIGGVVGRVGLFPRARPAEPAVAPPFGGSAEEDGARGGDASLFEEEVASAAAPPATAALAAAAPPPPGGEWVRGRGELWLDRAGL